ncbi:HAD family hydrolase [Sanguibacter massiliensis]|uniref:HAD family hydrolase n=1 Tax=Sanguibacter massiliensis TaxID=1973217 RepID=UPI000C842015|nr:HAD family hydrolase [Sanguibacter massiliensis]
MREAPRVVATDLDGTLLRSDGTVSDRTRSVLRRLDDAGVRVVFVTARPPRWLPALADLAGGHGTAVVLNGAAVYEFATGTLEQVHGFERAAAASIVDDLRAAIPGLTFVLERIDGPVYDPGFVSTHPVPADARRVDVATTLVAHGDPCDAGPGAVVGKILARHDRLGHDELYARVADVVGNRGILAYSGAHALAELSAPGVTKAAGLARWCAAHDVTPADVWAFGDMPNDLPMLTWAGHGVAVANAHPEVLAHADAQTASNDADGFASYVERLLG